MFLPVTAHGRQRCGTPQWLRGFVCAVTMVVIAANLAPARAAGVSASAFARAKLVGINGQQGEGTALFYFYRRHAQIRIHVHGLTRQRDPFYLLWLPAKTGSAWIGGGFFRTERDSFSGVVSVPGAPRVSVAHCHRASKLLVTQVSNARARSVVKE